ncbi:MAG TPA: hypothetical protein VHT91_02435 [Kofleriaceae bacterium]|jgi:hypothetical protein|nr:hypothetical protein [Kofleriaceae bacterium]
MTDLDRLIERARSATVDRGEAERYVRELDRWAQPTPAPRRRWVPWLAAGAAAVVVVLVVLWWLRRFILSWVYADRGALPDARANRADARACTDRAPRRKHHVRDGVHGIAESQDRDGVIVSGRP